MRIYTWRIYRAGLKGRGARGNFYWRAPMTYFMTSSFVKVTFSLIFFPIVENVLTQMHVGCSELREENL